MYQVLEKPYLQKLRTILQSNIFYIGLIIFLVVYVIYFTKIKDYTSIYSDETRIEGIVTKIVVNEDNVKLTLDSKEDIIATYYYDDEKEIENLKLGIKVAVEGNLREPLGNSIPNVFNYKKYLETKKIYYLFTAKQINILDNNVSFLYRIKNFLITKCDQIDSLGYIKSLVLGINEIDDNIYDIYKVNGIMHLFAISGMHISLVANVLLKLLKKMLKNKDVIMIIIIIVLFFYTKLIGFTPSVLRSLYMYIFIWFNKRFKLSLSNTRILILITIIMLILNPFYIYDIGFLYSMSTSLGLIIYSKSLDNGNKIISSLKISFIANIFSLPISINNNYEVNLLTLIINVIAVPLITYIIYPICLLVLLLPIFYPLLKITIIFLETVSKLFYSIKVFIITIPKMSMFLIFIYYLLLFLIVRYNKRYYKILLLFILVFSKYHIFLDSNTYVYFLDVGQGDSSLIVTPHRKDIILIDTGGIYNNNYPIENIITFLKSMGFNKIDYLILTHGDYDHMGYSTYLVNNYKVDKVFFNKESYSNLELELIDVLKDKDIYYQNKIKTLDISNSRLYFLNEEYYGNENDDSLVIYMKLNNYKFLFMGDASIKVENDLIKKYNLQNIDILKVGHHGSKTSSSKYFINYISPKYSIISVGKNNLFGHPNQEVLKNLNDSKVLRTDINGSIEFKIKKSKLEVKYYSP